LPLDTKSLRRSTKLREASNVGVAESKTSWTTAQDCACRVTLGKLVAEAPTTGDPVLDELIKKHFTEAIGITHQVLLDRIPEMGKYAERYNGQTCAILCLQLWPIFGALFVEGAGMNIAGLLGGEPEDGG